MRMNKYPFFLWLTEKKDDLTLDLANNRVYNDKIGESSITKVHFGWIILMKYIPILWLSYFFFIPRNLFEVGLFFASLVFALVLFALLNYELIFKAVILVFCVISFYLIFKFDDYAVHLSTALTLFVQIVLIAIVLYDILVLKGYRNWYFLSSFRNQINVKVAQKKERKLFYFWKKNIGFNIKRQIPVRGYFLRIDDEDIK